MSSSISMRALCVALGFLVLARSQDEVVAPGWCSTYGGTCEVEPPGGTNELFKRTCANNTEAVVPDFNIAPTCPEFADGPVCCDSIQYTELRDNIKKASAIFSRCPACIENFKRLWCAYTCHPDQSTFKKVLREEPAVNLPNSMVVAEASVAVGDEWATKFYDSCKSVVFPSTGDTVMETIFGAKSAYDFLEFQGRNATYGGQSPEMIYFSLTDTVNEDNSSIADTDLLFDCHAPDDLAMQCSCTDCLESCSSNFVVGQLPPDDRDLVELPRIDLTMGWTYAGVLLAVVIVATACPTVFGPIVGAQRKERDQIAADEELDEAIREASMIPKQQSKRSLLSRIFYQIGLFDARHPYLVIGLSLLFTGICCIGIINLELLTDPEGLWVPADAQVAKDKAQFDEDFAPFYRIEQAFFQRDPSVEENFENGTLRDMWQLDIVRKMIEYQDQVEAVVVEHEGMNITWQDVCYKPIPGQSCMVQSPLEFFNGQAENYARDNPNLSQETVENVFETCTKNIVSPNCRGAIGAPTFPNVVFTGYPRNTENFSDATGFAITYLVDNHKAMRPLAEVWEAEVLKIMEKGIPGLTMAYSVERALEDELSKDIAGDIVIIALSYVIMFVYIGIALGRLRAAPGEHFHSFGARFRAILSRLKFGLGLAGILVVICALGIAVGLCAMFGLKATLIIAEVIPFLVLAIGIDNVFIIVSGFQSMNKRVDMDIRLAETLALVSTNITLAAMAEVFTFFLGALTRMPAVQAFAVYSAVAILFDFFLQITMFSAILVLDAKRQESGKADIFCCARVVEPEDTRETREARERGQKKSSTYRPPVSPDAPTPKSLHAFNDDSDERRNDGLRSSGSGGSSLDKNGGLLEDPMYIGYLKAFSRKYYMPFLLHRVTKVLVVLGFVAMLFVGIAYTSDRLELGLDQKVALPRDSHLQDYFTAIEEDLRTGPPVYFVVNGDAERLLNFSDYDDQNRICGLPGCDEDSLTGTVNAEALSPAITRIATASTSWLDDYISWLTNPADCCRKGTGNSTLIGEGEYCPPPDQGPQIPVDDYDDPDTGNVCIPCVAPEDYTYNGTRVSVEDFDFYLEWFLASECSDRCGLCGTGHYEHVKLDENGRVEKARFMSFHDVLVTQKDFIDSMLEARRVSEEIAENQNLDVYPYSIHYVFFDQYEFIGNVALMNSLYAGIAIIVLCLIILRNFWTSILIVATVAMIIVDLLGFMALWDIQLNAVSVVNIVMAIGISVEFLVHTAVVFLRAKGSHDQRMRVAFIQMGSTVVQGIFATNLFPVFVLAFARSQIFEIYYFRMYLGIMLIAGAHGLIWTPVLLSMIGPQENAGWLYHSQDTPVEATDDEIQPLKRAMDNGNVNSNGHGDRKVLS